MSSGARCRQVSSPRIVGGLWGEGGVLRRGKRIGILGAGVPTPTHSHLALPQSVRRLPNDFFYPLMLSTLARLGLASPAQTTTVIYPLLFTHKKIANIYTRI